MELDEDLELEADLIAEKPQTIDYIKFAFDRFRHHEVGFVVLESAPPQHHLPLHEIANNEVEIMIQKNILTKCYASNVSRGIACEKALKTHIKTRNGMREQ